MSLGYQIQNTTESNGSIQLNQKKFVRSHFDKLALKIACSSKVKSAFGTFDVRNIEECLSVGAFLYRKINSPFTFPQTRRVEGMYCIFRLLAHKKMVYVCPLSDVRCILDNFRTRPRI